MDRRIAWMAMGLLLDGAALLPLSMTIDFPIPVGTLNYVLKNILIMGFCGALALLHFTVLPKLIWTTRCLTALDAFILIAETCLILPFLVVCSSVVAALLFVVFSGLQGFGVSGKTATSISAVAAYGLTGALTFYTTAGLGTLAGSKWVWARQGTWGSGTGWGGAFAGVLLCMAATMDVWNTPGASGLALPYWVFSLLVVLAGLPHLLLAAQRLPAEVAPLPKAARRVGITSLVLAVPWLALLLL